MINDLNITESKFKFFRPRIIAFLSFIVMFIWNIYFLIFYNYTGNVPDMFAMFQLLCAFVFAVTFVIGILSIFIPNSKIYHLNSNENKFVIFEKAAFADIYKIYQYNFLKSIQEALVEDESKQKGAYNLIIKFRNNNESLKLLTGIIKSTIQCKADEINSVLSGKTENFTIQNYNNKYIENTYIILIIIQLILYSDIIKQVLLQYYYFIA